ncbi:hypothetical protein JOL62DRAFT_639704 [Phyllosticta paracitricarpa]|uniref:Pyruvate carboxylase n=1 Tax=Phyllosticta paracitricarpa TaxID=2016321 RepID=A0ABR1N3M7_9PEZI
MAFKKASLQVGSRKQSEIATRILSAARDLDIETYAVFTSSDTSHVLAADNAIELSSTSSYLNVSELVEIAKRQKIDAIHPGYGFLSESAEFARRMWDEAGVVVIGPGWEILEATGDKLKARALAEACRVPVCPALERPTDSIRDIEVFASHVGFPIMVKAVDGGGGRGIRLIRRAGELENAARRAIEESPSRQVFAEKAAIDGFRHVEVQIVGDGKGNVRHVWERECSIQRRYQKVVEVAPSTISDRGLVGKVIEAAVEMAKKVQYFSLGTFEFLVNPQLNEFFFLEINPRLQVEHTITESISSIDLVRAQLLLAQGSSLASCGLPNLFPASPPLHSIQLRITAEDPQNNWALSVGTITSFRFPSGNGVRVDTHLVQGHAAKISPDFDSLVAKLVVTAPTWNEVRRKARRALDDTRIEGVKTNLSILHAIVAHGDFAAGHCSTQWLETQQASLVAEGARITTALAARETTRLSSIASSTAAGLKSTTSTATAPLTNVSASTLLFRKGDAWDIELTPSQAGVDDQHEASKHHHHLELTRILRNDFPASLAADIAFASPGTTKPTPYTLSLTASSASAAASASPHPLADPRDPSHVALPLAGTLVELCVDAGDAVAAGDVVAVVRQMKMEVEVRSEVAGRVEWVMEVEEGEEVAEGWLVCVVDAKDGEGVVGVGEGEEKTRDKAKL